jgi:hypothetical protein
MRTTLWHYTTFDRFRGILADGAIRPTGALIAPGERAAVWFTSRDSWEPTATKWHATEQRPATLREMCEGCGGLVRIGVDVATAPVGWREHARRFLNVKHARSLEIAGRVAGSDPLAWYVSYTAVPSALWIAVEVWDDVLGWVNAESLLPFDCVGSGA